MSTSSQRTSQLAVVLVALALISPSELAAQLVSARPASVSLTVVVQPHVQAEHSVTSEGRVAVVSATPNLIDLESSVGLTGRPPSRVEVRLGATWNADSTRVWVRNPRGEFERLSTSARIVALDGPAGVAGAHSPLRFRVESNSRVESTTLAIPVEYRLTVGSADVFSVWTFPAVLRVDAGALRPDSVSR